MVKTVQPEGDALPDSSPVVSIVLPTYAEAENLPWLVPEVVASMTGAGHSCEVIVVDDDSPDQTAAVAENLAREHPVRVLRRTGRRGLAVSVVEGFGIARGEILVVMDADGSHPPAAIPELVEAVAGQRAPIAVGSRHIRGGGFRRWPLPSRLGSRLAALLARGLTTLSDPTSGLMAIRREFFQGLELDPVGWKIVLETVVKAHPAPFVEIPIVFEGRRAGRSKQNVVVFAQFVWHCCRLGFSRSSRPRRARAKS